MSETTPSTGRDHVPDDMADADATPPLGVPAIVQQTPEPAATRRRRFGRRRDRVSKWDRPPAPRDWRFFVGGLGKVLIAVGVMLFGFVAYQLWGTGLETARAQNRLEDEFEAALADVEFEVGPATAADDSPTGVEPAPDTDQPADDPADETTGNPADDPADETTGDPADDPADETTGDEANEDGETENGSGGEDTAGAVEYDIPPIVRGEPIARLEIPRLGQRLLVVPGVGVDDLKQGPGHYPDTPLPGQLGNSAIAGHRTTYGEPFIDLDDLEPGDELIVTTLYGQFVYDVTSSEVVEASDSWVIQTEDWDTATITLTTCHPKYSAARRLIVRGVLDEAKSSGVGVSTFYELGESGGEIEGDDPTLTETTVTESEATEPTAAESETTSPTTPTTAPDDTATNGATNGSTNGAASDAAATDDAPAVTAPAPTGTDAPAAAPNDDDLDPEDAFSRGWFDDEEAFPQIALWGSALSLISVLAYAISRRTRHDSIGFLVGVAPFAIAMFFFFQNVHRLLPPGL